MANPLEIFGKVAGLGGLALGVFFLLFLALIRTNIFPKLSTADAYRTIRLFMFLTFLMGSIGIAAWVYGSMPRTSQVSQPPPAATLPPAQSTSSQTAAPPPKIAAEDVIVLLDMSRSVADVLPTYLTAVERLIMALPETDRHETCFTVIGITAASYERPFKIAMGCLPSGPSGILMHSMRRAEAKHVLTKQWREANIQLGTASYRTDVLGAIAFTAKVFRGYATKRTMVIASDMRHFTAEINLEGAEEIDDRQLQRVRELRLLADLSGVEVCVVGVHALGLSGVRGRVYHESLLRFWRRYFQEAHARLLGIRVDVPEDLGRATIEQACKG